MNRRWLIFITVAVQIFVVRVSFASGLRTIVIDPGHGGYDSGAKGPEGTTEKDVTLALARLIASQMEGRYRVLLTRTGDYQIKTADRVAKANHDHADLFLSIHVGGGFSIKNNTITVYWPGGESGSDQKPKAYTITDFSGEYPAVVWGEAQQDHHRLSKAFAEILGQECRNVFGKCSRVKSGQINVLEGADMPAAMIEIGCMVNPSWEKQFRDPDRMVIMSDMITSAIERFFRSE